MITATSKNTEITHQSAVWKTCACSPCVLHRSLGAQQQTLHLFLQWHHAGHVTGETKYMKKEIGTAVKTKAELRLATFGKERVLCLWTCLHWLNCLHDDCVVLSWLDLTSLSSSRPHVTQCPSIQAWGKRRWRFWICTQHPITVTGKEHHSIQTRLTLDAGGITYTYKIYIYIYIILYIYIHGHLYIRRLIIIYAKNQNTGTTTTPKRKTSQQMHPPSLKWKHVWICTCATLFLTWGQRQFAATTKLVQFRL